MLLRYLSTSLLLTFCLASFAQIPNPALVGFWHNWNDQNAPYIPLNQIDDRYNVIEVSFAIPVSASNMKMLFSPDGIGQAEFIAQIQQLQNQGKKVLISIGGATASINLETQEQKNAFSNSMLSILTTYGFDGMNIDIEYGNVILASGSSITEPASIPQQNLTDAIKQIMQTYHSTNQRKLLLTMAPETAYVQGGQSAFGSIWGGYLPIIHALRDSIDLLQVQLYNSGTMYGIDGAIYTQGTADFIVALTEATIQGFNTTAGFFAGLPASKIAVGLPACPNAAGGGYTDSATVVAAINYLLGNGPQPGNYTLQDPTAYPDLGGMMTWSINWDAVETCAGTYQYANIYQHLFDFSTSFHHTPSEHDFTIFPNPSNGHFQVALPFNNALIRIHDYQEKMIDEQTIHTQQTHLTIAQKGLYLITVQAENQIFTKRMVIN